MCFVPCLHQTILAYALTATTNLAHRTIEQETFSCRDGGQHDASPSLRVVQVVAQNCQEHFAMSRGVEPFFISTQGRGAELL